MSHTKNLEPLDWKQVMSEYNSGGKRDLSYSPHFANNVYEHQKQTQASQKTSEIQKSTSIRMETSNQNKLEQSFNNMHYQINTIKLNNPVFQVLQDSIIMSENVSFNIPRNNTQFVNHALSEVSKLNNIISSFKNNMILIDPVSMIIDKQHEFNLIKKCKNHDFPFAEPEFIKRFNTETQLQPRSSHLFKTMINTSKKQSSDTIPHINLVKQQSIGLTQLLLISEQGSPSIRMRDIPSIGTKVVSPSMRLQEILSEGNNTNLNSPSMRMKEMSLLENKQITKKVPISHKPSSRLPKMHSCSKDQKQKKKHEQPLRYRSISSYYGPEQMDFYLNKNYMNYSNNSKWIKDKLEVSTADGAEDRFYDLTLNGKGHSHKQKRSSTVSSQRPDTNKSHNDFVDELRLSLQKQKYNKQSNDDFMIKICKTESAQKYSYNKI